MAGRVDDSWILLIFVVGNSTNEENKEDDVRAAFNSDEFD